MGREWGWTWSLSCCLQCLPLHWTFFSLSFVRIMRCVCSDGLHMLVWSGQQEHQLNTAELIYYLWNVPCIQAHLYYVRKLQVHTNHAPPRPLPHPQAPVQCHTRGTQCNVRGAVALPDTSWTWQVMLCRRRQCNGWSGPWMIAQTGVEGGARGGACRFTIDTQTPFAPYSRLLPIGSKMYH